VSCSRPAYEVGESLALVRPPEQGTTSPPSMGISTTPDP